VQRSLGQDGFNALVRHAYDSGIRFFESAEAYPGMHEMLGIALKGIPRENYRLMTRWRQATARIRRPRSTTCAEPRKPTTSTSCCCTCRRRPTAVGNHALQDVILQAEHKQAVRSHGASVHGLPALRQVPTAKWLEIA